jgi:hypothetical protein
VVDKIKMILPHVLFACIIAFVFAGEVALIILMEGLTPFEQHIQDRIKAADSMAITAQEKAVRVRTEGGVE